MWLWLACLAVAAVFSNVDGAGAGAARLICYVKNAHETSGFSECTHLVYAGNSRGEKLEALLKEYRKNNPQLKIILRIAEADKDLRKLLKSKYIQGLEISDAHRSLNRSTVEETVEAARQTLRSTGGGPLFLSVPSHPELLAKYYDMRSLMKKVDLMVVQTHNLGEEKKMTYHPSRLSGVWDMMNTDSVVDLVIGLGVPASKVVISLPSTALKFSLQNETLSTPGSPAVEDEPKEISQMELCRMLQKGRWTLERDQDLSAPYAFQDKIWVSFEDSSSVDVKGKYARVRGLAGLALMDSDKDVETSCGASLKAALAKVLKQQSRAPRAAVLRSLEHEILSAPVHARALDALQVSPYRITQVVDSDGVIHSIREDTRTEFSCTRQGYFVHPRSCARFYRCVKFDQLSDEYTVFEFDCPSGLAFDSRYEVCVWPGSLPDSQACPGSSEIAPVPHTRFVCPDKEGYYADPENCRWFFACLDHGKAPLTAYEFRCPFGLGFDAQRLKCDWPWLVPQCGNIARYEAQAHGFSTAVLTGAVGYRGQTADAINVAAHHSLASGAAADNLVGIQTHNLGQQDALDSNFIASQELADGLQNGVAYQNNDVSLNGNIGLIQPKKYNEEEKYTSGSIILDDYRLPTKPKSVHGQVDYLGYNKNPYSGSVSSSNVAQKYIQYQQYQNSGSYEDQSGRYIHDPTGDHAEPYKHVDAQPSPYVHQNSGYSDYYDVGKYAQGKYQENYKYTGNENSGGQYVHDNSGAYVSKSDDYRHDNSGSYVNDNSGQYVAGVYRTDAHIGNENIYGTANGNRINIDGYQGGYSNTNTGNYLTNTKAYTGSSHTLTNGAVNVGLVGKTTLVDANYNDQFNYKPSGYSTSSQVQYQNGQQVLHPGHVAIISQPAVSISHVGTDSHNLDGYSFVTTPTPPVIPSTGAPYAVTSIPTVSSNYHTTYVPEPPKSTIKQIFGITQQPITYVQSTVTPVASIQVTNHNQGVNYNAESAGQTVNSESGYSYDKPTVKFEDGLTYSAPTATVSTYEPQGFGHSQQTLHKVESVGFEYATAQPVTEEPFKKIVAYTTGPSIATYSPPTIATYTPQSISHQTIHQVNVKQEPKVFEYTTAQPQILVQSVTSSAQPQYQETIHNVDVNHVNTYPQGESGYEYSKPAVHSEAQNTIQYTKPASDVSVSNGQAYSHQTVHTVNSQSNTGYDYSKPVVTVPQQTVIQYSTPATETVQTNNAQSYSQQTLHNSYNQEQAGYEYAQPTVQLKEQKYTVQYSTPATLIPTNNAQSYSKQTLHNAYSQGYVQSYQQPAVSLYQNPILKYIQKVTPAVSYAAQPQSYSQQTYHKVEGSKVSLPSVATAEHQVQYTTAQPHLEIQPQISVSQPHVFSHQTLHQVDVGRVNALVENGGYEYQKPVVQQTPLIQYTTSAPTEKPALAFPSQSYSQQTLHNVDAGQVSAGFKYQQPIAQLENVQKTIQYSVPTPTQIPIVSTYQPQVYSHQTLHKVNAGHVSTYSEEQGYAYQKPAVELQAEPKTIIKYTTPTPTIVSYQPQVYSQQTLHKVESPQVNTYSEESYQRPLVNLEQEQKTFVQYSTPRPVVVSTYRPQTYNAQVIHKVANIIPVSSTELPQVDYQQPAVTVYENPILKFTKNVTPKPVTAVTSHLYQPIQYQTVDQQSYSNVQPGYNQPEIQRDYEQSNAVKGYSDATLVSQQTFNLGSGINENNKQQITFVSTTPANLAYEDHYSQYEIQKSNPFQVQDNYDYKPLDDTQQYDINQKDVKISFRNEQRKNEGSVHFSRFPGTRVVTKYEKVNNIYHEPEVQVGYQAEEYLPPVVSTSIPVVTSTYRPVTVSTTKEYLPPPKPTYSSPEYLPPRTEKEYLPPSTTARPYVESTTPIFIKSTTSREYLPPSDDQQSHVVNFESFGLKNIQEGSPAIAYNPYGRQKNIVVQAAKSNLLGFGTVGPDAGLVSPVTYTTSTPIISSSSVYTPRPVEPAEITPFAVPVRKLRPRVRPISSTTEPQYKYVESTTQFQAPEYLPPNIKTVQSIPRKHNLVVQTAKSNLLGYSTVGPDAGLLSTVSTLAPIEVPSSEKYYAGIVTSTYAPSTEQVVEVVRRPIPSRRTKPKVAVVTKINDFNPLLVRKLGAVCSCQSPIVVLRGRRPSTQQEAEDYDTDYDQDGRGDIVENTYGHKAARLQTIVSSAAPVTSTFNPIIVPDDSYYQDYEDGSNVQEIESRINVKSSTPSYSTTTEKIVRIRPRVKSVTVAPTYQTVLLKQAPTPVAIVQESGTVGSSVESQSFNRYGPGGWRGRDETLQGSVDCQRAGLFRHPKHCNKFYSCVWDCSKQRFTLHVFNCPVQLSFDSNLGACNWPSQGPACQGDTLLANAV